MSADIPDNGDSIPPPPALPGDVPALQSALAKSFFGGILYGSALVEGYKYSFDKVGRLSTLLGVAAGSSALYFARNKFRNWINSDDARLRRTSNIADDLMEHFFDPVSIHSEAGRHTRLAGWTAGLALAGDALYPAETTWQAGSFHIGAAIVMTCATIYGLGIIRESKHNKHGPLDA